MTVNLGAYAGEIVRAGIDATPRGQVEAGLSLALSRRYLLGSDAVWVAPRDAVLIDLRCGDVRLARGRIGRGGRGVAVQVSSIIASGAAAC